MIVLQKFISKKNDVRLISEDGNEFVYKKFADRDSFEKEKYYYASLGNQIKIPELIKCDEDNGIIILEYIKGKTLLEALENCEAEDNKSKAYNLFLKLYYWLEKFYCLNLISENNLVFYDINFRNFIVEKSTSKLFGIDFESVEHGSYIDELCKLPAVYLKYNPEFSDFKRSVSDIFINHLSNALNLESCKVRYAVNKEIRVVEERRKGKRDCTCFISDIF